MKEQQPIRVAHIVGKMVGGGVEAFIMNYYRNIDRTKIQFDFIIDSDSTIVPKEEIEKLGGRIIIVPPYQKVFSYIKELRKILNENKYKIVHSHLNSLSVFPLFGAYLAKVPVRIAHSHSTTNKREWKKNIIKNILKSFSKVFSTHYFACSEHAAKWLFGKKALNNEQVEIIHNAIDLEKFKYNDEIRNRIRKELHIEDKLVIGHVGRFVEQKNHMFLINVFHEIQKNNSDTILILLGDGPLEKKIKERVLELNLQNSVFFMGIRDDVNEIMQAMDVFLFPSLYEGLGLVLVEAQCVGCPCIISDQIPSEVVMNNNVIRVNLTDSLQIWKKSVLENDKNFSRNAYNIIKEKGYDISIKSKELENRYIQILDNIS